MTSDAGALLLGAADRAINLVDRFAGCFRCAATIKVRTRIASPKFAPERIFIFSCQVTRCRASRNCPFRHGSPMAARAGTVKVGCRIDLQVGSEVDRPHLDGDEHDATLGPSGWTLGLQTCG
ncbi:hypothetical protein ACVIJ6_000854 [Bradyrhizobium sp. USDA 4369]